MSDLIHLIYASKDAVGLDPEEVRELLAKARENNEEHGITGMLLFADGSFFQVLEGKEEHVEAVFEAIKKDDRHKNIVRIIREAISERSFGRWSMGYAAASGTDLNEIEGLNDFFAEGSCLADIDRGRAKKLLNVFAKGKWRLG